MKPLTFAKCWGGVFFILIIVSANSCNTVKDPINELKREVAEGISDMEVESSGWRELAQRISTNIPSEVGSLVRNELNNLAAQASADVGVELRGNTDFLGRRLKARLIRIQALLNGKNPADLPDLPPAVIRVIPSAVDLNLEPNQRKEMLFSGYDLNSKTAEGRGLTFALVRADETILILHPSSAALNSWYQAKLNLSEPSIEAELQSGNVKQIVAFWGDNPLTAEFWKDFGQFEELGIISTINVLRKTPTSSEYTIPSSSITYTPRHIGGDADFNTGNNRPTKVKVAARTRISTDKKKVEFDLYMYARESRPDHTKVGGWQSEKASYRTIKVLGRDFPLFDKFEDGPWRTLYTAPEGTEIVAISLIDQASATRNTENQDTLEILEGPGGLIKRWAIRVDHGGNEAGTWSQVVAHTNPITVKLKPVGN